MFGGAHFVLTFSLSEVHVTKITGFPSGKKAFFQLADWQCIITIGQGRYCVILYMQQEKDQFLLVDSILLLINLGTGTTGNPYSLGGLAILN